MGKLMRSGIVKGQECPPHGGFMVPTFFLQDDTMRAFSEPGELIRRGARVPVTVALPGALDHAVPGDALIGTGAGRTLFCPVMTRGLFDGVPPSRKAPMRSATSGRWECAPLFEAVVTIGEKDAYTVEGPCISAELGEGIMLLLGRDILRWCRLSYDGLAGTFRLDTFPPAMP